MAYQSQDIIRRSATNGFTPAPQARDHQQEVAKLIDVTTCIGCKALPGGLLRMERSPVTKWVTTLGCMTTRRT